VRFREFCKFSGGDFLAFCVVITYGLILEHTNYRIRVFFCWELLAIKKCGVLWCSKIPYFL
jgi:hypothetical protein